MKIRAFTLIELMIVIGIMAVIVAMGIPMIYHTLHKEGLTKAVNDTVEVLGTARRLAILQGRMTEVIFHPKESRLEVAGGASPRPSANESEGAAPANTPAPDNSGLSAQLPSNVIIEMLDVNMSGIEYRDAEFVRVRFYPNGTCDELTMLLRSDQNQRRGISLEVTTGLASVLNDADLQKLAYGKP